jgi:dTDP-4-dehydrorhamnose reductase
MIRSNMRVLVVGADGLIGRALFSELRKRGDDVVGTTRHADRVQTGGSVFLDLAADQLGAIPQADVVVVCAAMARFSECRDNFDLAHRVNVDARLAITQSALKTGARVIALSSSAVFDCMRPKARADWAMAPRSAYGRLIAKADAGVLASGGSLLRLTKVLSSEAGLFPEWIATLRVGGTVQAFEDHTFCPLPLSDVIAAIIAMIDQPDSGIFQVSGASDISYVDAVRHIAVRIGVSRERVMAIRAVDHGIPESDVTPFTSLDTSRLSALTQFEPPQASAVIDSVYRSLLTGNETGLNA